MFRDMGKLVTFTGQFHSELITLPIHYFGRSIPCAGPDCEACLYRSARLLGYAALCGTDGVAKFYELSESFTLSVREAMSAAGIRVVKDAAHGLVVAAHRATTRNGWLVDRVELVLRRGVSVETPQLLGQVSRLFRLPTPLSSESWSSWFERVRGSQNDLLRACLLPFGRRNRESELSLY